MGFRTRALCSCRYLLDRAPDIAYSRFHEGLPHIHAVGDRYMLILSLNYLGMLVLVRGDVREAEQVLTEALECSNEIGNRIGQVSALNRLVKVACARAAWAEAIDRCYEALDISRKVGDR